MFVVVLFLFLPRCVWEGDAKCMTEKKFVFTLKGVSVKYWTASIIGPIFWSYQKLAQDSICNAVSA